MLNMRAGLTLRTDIENQLSVDDKIPSVCFMMLIQHMSSMLI